MFNTQITIEGNLAADVEMKENAAGGVYVDAVVLVNQGHNADGTDRPATRHQVRITGRTAENATTLAKGTRLLIVGNVVTDCWHDKTTGDRRYAQRVLASTVAVSLTFARVVSIERNQREREQQTTEHNDRVAAEAVAGISA